MGASMEAKKAKIDNNIDEKSRARPASPRSRPTSPVNGAGGITGCRNDSEAPGVVPSVPKYFRTRLSDRGACDLDRFVRVVFAIAMGRGTNQMSQILKGIFGVLAVSLTFG